MEGEGQVESWLEEQALAFLACSRSERADSPEAFAARLDPPFPSPEPARSRLVERLRILERLERGLGSPSDEPIASGARLPDFEVCELIGRGGMGRVFRARQLSLGREVAIKVPMWPLALDGAARLRFLREAQAVAQLRHPAIVPLHQVGEHGGAPFLVLELVAGRSLAEILREVGAGRAPRAGAALGRPGVAYERAAAELTLEILSALEAAHGAGIVHRDLKPGNVMVEASGRVRVLDFGLARLRGQESQTGSREELGTPGYMAPELLRDARAAGPRSDLYAVGVLLYEVLALEHPFAARSQAEQLARIEAGSPAPLAQGRRAPRALSAIVEKALARPVEARYPSAQAFADDLRAFLAGREVQARPSTALDRLGRRLQRHPAASALALFLFLALGLFASAWRGQNVVQAHVDGARASELTRSALLWEFADGVPGGGAPQSRAGIDRAYRDLRAALELDPHLIEARVRLARACVATERNAEALELLDALEREGVQLRAIGWTRAWALDRGRRGVYPDPGEELDEEGLAPLDRLAFAHGLLTIPGGPSQNERAIEVLRPLEDHPILGPAASYLQFEACHTRGRRDFARARGYLMGALAVLPEHPIALSNLASLLDQVRTNARPAGRSEPDAALAQLEADLDALCVRLERALERDPQVLGLWTALGAALLRGGQAEEARAVAERALAQHSDDPQLMDLLAHAHFARWEAALQRGEHPLAEEVADLVARLERALARGDRGAKNTFNLVRAYYIDDDPAACGRWYEILVREVLPGEPAIVGERLRANLEIVADWLASSGMPPAVQLPPAGR